MKRLKRKRFKRQIDLIRCAIKNVLDKQLAELRTQRKKALEHLKKTNWLEYAKYKVRN